MNADDSGRTPPARLRCWLLGTSACLSMLLAVPGAAGQERPSAPASAPQTPAQDAQPQSSQGTPPPGFEDLDQAVDTLFDVYVLGRRIGSFRAVVSAGRIRFVAPEEIATALEGVVDRDAVLQLLRQPLDTHEQYRCFPGQTVNCGLLPPGEEGVIADPQRFSVELFFNPAAIRRDRPRRLTLGPSSSDGPTLVQNIAMSIASNGFSTDEIEVGGTFDTFASVGPTALIAQTFVGTGFGARLNQGHIQHIWENRIARAGLIEDFSTTLLTNYRMVGGEFGSFYPNLAYESESFGTPIDIVLSRDADVEIRRNGVLVSVRHYTAGPQRLDTSNLPNGSYPISIVARAEGAVILDEVRSFSRGGGLPIPGETEFKLRAGLFVEDRFTLTQQQSDFFPSLRRTPVLAASVRRRIGAATGVEATVLRIDRGTYGEATLRTFLGNIEGSVTAAVGDDGSYGASVMGSALVGAVRLNLAARVLRTDALPTPTSLQSGRYQPFLRREDSVVGSAQFNIFDGSLNLSGSYSRSPGIDDRYTVSARYARTVEMFQRSAFLSTYAQASNNETRFGVALTRTFGLDRRTTASVTGGAEYLPRSRGSAREGFSPVVNASITRREQWDTVDVLARADARTSADGERLGLSANLASPVGVADLSAQHVRTRAGNFTTLIGNAQTGFAIGGGGAKFGIANAGDAVILNELDVAEDRSAGGANQRNSGYRVRINSQNYDLLKPGSVSAAGVPAYDDYDVSLTPENAPPYDVRLDGRTVTLYPGNVVRLRYSASRDYTLFGQAIDRDGTPVRDARVQAGSDYTRSDENGYFTVTGTSASRLEIKRADGSDCFSSPLGDLVDKQNRGAVERLGQIRCADAGDSEATAPAKQGARPAAKGSADRTKTSSAEPVEANPVRTLLMLARADLDQLDRVLARSRAS